MYAYIMPIHYLLEKAQIIVFNEHTCRQRIQGVRHINVEVYRFLENLIFFSKFYRTAIFYTFLLEFYPPYIISGNFE